MTEDNRKLTVTNTYYSHLSRLFVSNYAMFFTVYLAFLALLYNVALRPESWAKIGFFVASVLIALFELGLLWRGRRFGRVLDQIDERWAKDGIMDVRATFWPKGSQTGRIDWFLRSLSVPIAALLVISIPVLSCLFLLRT